LIYAGAYWLYDHKYYLAQLHNIIKIPPAVFIIYFYDHGLYLLLKLPGILADIGLTFLIYKIVEKITQNAKKALAAGAFYLFNPVSIFLSGVWGQTDSLVSLLGLASFFTLWTGRVWISIPLLFLSLYTKPNWGIFIPLYLFLLILKKPNVKKFILGLAISLVLFWATTAPFAKDNLISFSSWLWSQRLLPTASVTHKASVGAFNLHTIFLTIDRDSDKTPYLGIPADFLGYVLFLVVNLTTFGYIKKEKLSLLSIMVGLFGVGFASYLFMTNMLERYFFQSFTPLIILMFSAPRTLLYGLAINLAVFANIFYAIFRRSWGEVADLFSANGFALIRIFSLVNLASWVLILRRLKFQGR
jgi:Gpi18-like mannosyltransferase